MRFGTTAGGRRRAQEDKRHRGLAQTFWQVERQGLPPGSGNVGSEFSAQSEYSAGSIGIRGDGRTGVRGDSTFSLFLFPIRGVLGGNGVGMRTIVMAMAFSELSSPCNRSCTVTIRSRLGGPPLYPHGNQ